MARAAKRSAKPSSSTTTIPPKSSLAVSSSSKPTTTPSTIPAPFSSAPTSLNPFLSTLPTHHIYLAHIDRTLAPLKRQVFLVPLLLNLAITLGLIIRLYYAIPTYGKLIIAIFGYDSPYLVDTKHESAISLASTLLQRTGLLFVDYALFFILGSWPREFIFGSSSSRYTGPLAWRWSLGFPEQSRGEVIVRKGRKWDTLLLRDDGDNERTWEEKEIVEVKFKTGPAMAKPILAKTGYLLLDKDYDLDFRAILDAHALAAETLSKLDLKELDECVFVHRGGKWLMWRPNEREEKGEEDPKVEEFKKALTERKCADVFYRWIEILQYETNQKTGFTKGRREEAEEELRKLLKAKGVRFDDIVKEVGGKENIPGLKDV